MRPPPSRSWVFWMLALIMGLFLVWSGRGVVVHCMTDLEAWMSTLGFWGPIGFGVLYVLAVVFLVPASFLTVAAGALFGIPGGLVVVSVASNLGAALAFLIARYLARGRVERWLAGSRRLQELDTEVRKADWRLVALLRLSPLVPFNVQNYFYGLTAISFWPCVLTSWVAMLPGTLLYVTLGYAGGTGLAVAGQPRARTSAEWALMGVGIASTIVLSLVLTQLLKRGLTTSRGSPRDPESFLPPSPGPLDPVS